MGWSVRQCWLMRPGATPIPSNGFIISYEMDRNGKKWHKNRGLRPTGLLFSLTPKYIICNICNYIYIYILPSNPNISHCLNHFGQISPFLHIPFNPVQFLVVKSLLSAHLFIQNFMLINSNFVLVYAILIWHF